MAFLKEHGRWDVLVVSSPNSSYSILQFVLFCSPDVLRSVVSDTVLSVLVEVKLNSLHLFLSKVHRRHDGGEKEGGENERYAGGLAVRRVPRRAAFFHEHQEHCKVITVSFAVAPLAPHYGHRRLTASTRHNGGLSGGESLHPPSSLQRMKTDEDHRQQKGDVDGTSGNGLFIRVAEFCVCVCG